MVAHEQAAETLAEWMHNFNSLVIFMFLIKDRRWCESLPRGWNSFFEQNSSALNEKN